jgi:hypothetical protein
VAHSITPMSKQLLKKLWDTGHFWNLEKPDTLNVDSSSLLKLNVGHPIVQQAIQSFQQHDLNYDALYRGYRFHTRKSDRHRAFVESAPPFDGELDPATKALLKLPRCPMPDHTPPPGARFGYDDPGLQRAVETMQEFAAGSGSWPSSGCDPSKPGIHSIVVRIDITRCPATIKAYIDKALAEVTKAYGEIGLSVRYALDSTTPCQIAKRFESLWGGTIGWNEFPSANTCNQTISGRLDTGYAPSNWLLWANLECHETGHGVGLQHTRGSIMNPSILLVDPLSWVGTPSFNTLKKYFGGVALTPDVPSWHLFLSA